jgi:hypothetical protein
MRSIAILAMAGLLTACGSQPANDTSSTAKPPVAANAEPAKNKGRTVKSADGSFEGEVFGTIRPNSRFSKIQIGMTMSQVNGLIRAPDDMNTHETGKRWIPFYYGGDVRLTEAYYKGEGCLTYTGGNQFGGGAGTLIAINADPSGKCFNS